MKVVEATIVQVVDLIPIVIGEFGVGSAAVNEDGSISLTIADRDIRASLLERVREGMHTYIRIEV